VFVAEEGDAGTNPGPYNGSGSLVEEAGVPSCEAGVQGGVCGCLDLTLLGDPPNLYFLLDRSASMTDDGKWSTIRTVIEGVIERIGPRGRFGAAVFPNPAGDECGPGVAGMPLTQGDAPAGTAGAAVNAFLAATNYTPSGGTPTAATINALAPALTAFAGKTFVILATDGGPNCDPNLTCGQSTCIPNIESDPGCMPEAGASCCTGEPLDCLDSAATVQAIAALAAAGVPTYVIGVPGSGPYAALLDQMALVGQVPQPSAPYYYPVDTADQAAFTAALSAVAAKITATCALNLSQPPPDPSQVNVYLDGVVVPANPTNGWTLSGSTITLEGTTCQSVLDGDALDVRVVAGCPTILQ
jgi:hypothetical protein